MWELDKMNINLNELSTPQLKAIKSILVSGVPATAEKKVGLSADSQDNSLCHDSPPKGYPKDKSEYGDPACYRYPLNTKTRCLAAWRYVHQDRNKEVLGDKWETVKNKIKSYAKEHYDLELESSESESVDWERVFVEYYDAETAGEGFIEPSLIRGENMKDENIEALQNEIETLKSERDAANAAKSELEEKASQVDALTEELNGLKEELDNLRQFKIDTEKAAEKAERVKDIKSKLDEAGIEANLEDEKEVDYWFNMPEDVLSTTISKMVEFKKGAEASASVKVPNITNNDNDDDSVSVVREGLKELKNK